MNNTEISQGASNLRQKILVVDDEADIRRLNAEVLAGCGYTVDMAEDGAAAWSALQANHYDLVVTDYNMPKLTGIQLIKQLHESQMAVPVIMVTGDLPTWEFAGPWIEPARILLKPYNFLDLVDMVEEVLNPNTEATPGPASPLNWQGSPEEADRAKNKQP